LSGSIYLDTNILISLFESHGASQASLWEFMRFAVDAEDVVLHTSALSFAELLVKPYANRDEILARQYLTLAKSQDWLSVHEIEPAVIDMAAVIKARLRLRLPDAIHLASATVHSCDYFLTFDVGITSVPTLDHPISGKPLGTSVQVVHPDPMSLLELSRAVQ
jgi:predicted nucleic acid-binding protein